MLPKVPLPRPSHITRPEAAHFRAAADLADDAADPVGTSAATDASAMAHAGTATRIGFL